MQAKAGEALEDDAGKKRPVIENKGKGADIEHLADQMRHDIGIVATGPAQSGQGDIDGDQDAGQEGDLALQQPEAGIDVSAESLGETVDDAEIAHGFRFPNG